jgi:hypothetical protein
MAETTEELKDTISSNGSEGGNGSRLPGKSIVLPAAGKASSSAKAGSRS